MTVQLALLKSGEEIIADMKEMVIPDGDDHRVIGYIFSRPCTVRLENKDNLSDLEGNKSYEIGLSPWIPLSASQDIRVTTEWVITLVDPVEKLKTLYMKGVWNDGKASETASATEQSDPSDGD